MTVQYEGGFDVPCSNTKACRFPKFLTLNKPYFRRIAIKESPRTSESNMANEVGTKVLT